MRRVYLDNNATTPIIPEVKEALTESLDIFGNPSSHHEFGRLARAKMEEARKSMADLIGADPEEIIFSSGGSESNNITLKGTICRSVECRPYGARSGVKIITSTIEHPSIMETCKCLLTEGYTVEYLPVDKYGLVDPSDLEKMITPGTALVSVMYANNETGTIQPIKELAEIAHRHGVLFHTDAVQISGKLRVNVKELDVDFLSMSGHKMYAPKGVGILYLKKGTKVCPLVSGGHQERGLRAGTENTLGIIAIGRAAEVAARDMEKDAARMKMLRDKLQNGILERIPHIRLNGHPERRAPNTLNVSFEYVEGEAILYMLDGAGIAVSTGSACSSGSLEPSHVLLAMGLSHEVAHGSIRMSLGKMTTEEDIDYVLQELPPIIERLRRMSPVYVRTS